MSLLEYIPVKINEDPELAFAIFECSFYRYKGTYDQIFEAHSYTCVQHIISYARVTQSGFLSGKWQGSRTKCILLDIFVFAGLSYDTTSSRFLGEISYDKLAPTIVGEVPRLLGSVISFCEGSNCIRFFVQFVRLSYDQQTLFWVAYEIPEYSMIP